MGIHVQYEELLHYQCKCILTLGYDWHVLHYNHYDSRWGMNPHDPREMYRDDYPTLGDRLKEIFDPFFLTRLILFSVISGAFVTIIAERLNLKNLKDKITSIFDRN